MPVCLKCLRLHACICAHVDDDCWRSPYRTFTVCRARAQLNEFMNDRRLPRVLRGDLRSCFVSAQRAQAPAEDALLDMAPAHLREQCLRHAHSGVIAQFRHLLACVAARAMAALAGAPRLGCTRVNGTRAWFGCCGCARAGQGEPCSCRSSRACDFASCTAGYAACRTGGARPF
jgi:hypothetical protein